MARAALLVAATFLVFAAAAEAHPSFRVDSAGDGSDVDPADQMCATAAGTCTLRAAIQQVNGDPRGAAAGPYFVSFTIGTGPVTISPASPLPPVTRPVVLNAATQPGFAGTPIVELEGTGAGPAAWGLELRGGSSIVRGFVVNRFAQGGILLFEGGGNAIGGNYIGTDRTGTLDRGNGGDGITIDSSHDNEIGGSGLSDRNVISGNAEAGVGIGRRPGAGCCVVVPSRGNKVEGNFIGTDASGSAALGNDGDGVSIALLSEGNVVGSPGHAPNVISANRGNGVLIVASGPRGNDVLGNYIGTDAAGAAALGNAGSGVRLGGPALSRVTGNVISGNGGAGVFLDQAEGAVVDRNSIGTDGTGTADLGNASDGVFSQNSKRILVGGPSRGNLISGNDGSGVFLRAGTFRDPDGNRVEGNLIGTDGSGTWALGNSSQGVVIWGGNANVVGGTLAGTRNVISGNDGSGVLVYASSLSHRILGNYVGTDVTGTRPVGNRGDGIRIDGGREVTIGGATPGERNVVSANGQNGVSVVFPGFIIVGSAKNAVLGNYIGTDAGGRADLGNGRNGVLVTDRDTDVGASVPGTGNVISGNGWNGVHVATNLPGSFPLGAGVRGNLIGTNATGDAALPNDRSGVLVTGTGRNTIGGTAREERNVVSGNGASGIEIAAGANRVLGNFVGTDALGSADLGNALSGIFLTGPENAIGGSAFGSRNVVSGNDQGGIVLYEWAATRNHVAGNYVGTDASGTAAIGNRLAGILVSRARENRIGGTSDNDGNLVSGNGQAGVVVAFADGNAVQGNRIGTDAGGRAPIPNGFGGIRVEHGSDNVIGGSLPTSVNLVKGNNGPGVAVLGSAAAGNVVRGNRIFENTGLGIDLAADGVTPNDRGDRDAGPNGLQNFPLVASAWGIGTTTTVHGEVLGAPSTTFVVELFANTSCDPSGFGEAERQLGTVTVTTDASGATGFAATFSTVLPNGELVTATATDPAGNTSELSRCTVAGLADLAVTVSDSPDPVPLNGTLAYTLTVENKGPGDANGVTLTDTLPGGVTFVSATSPCTHAGGVVTCPLGSLSPGAVATRTVEVTAATAGSIVNTARVAGIEPDPDASNDAATETTVVLTAGQLLFRLADRIRKTPFEPPAFAKGLLAQLRAIEGALERERTAPACRLLGAWIRRVETQAGKRLDAADAALLAAKAREVATAAGCA